MRPQLWDYTFTKIDLEDLDVSVQLSHPTSLATVTIDFRVDQSVLGSSATDIKARIEGIARDLLLNLVSKLEEEYRLRPTG